MNQLLYAKEPTSIFKKKDSRRKKNIKNVIKNIKFIIYVMYNIKTGKNVTLCVNSYAKIPVPISIGLFDNSNG